MRKTIKQLETELAAAKADAERYRKQAEDASAALAKWLLNGVPQIQFVPYVVPQLPLPTTNPYPWWGDTIYYNGQTTTSATLTVNGQPVASDSIRVQS